MLGNGPKTCSICGKTYKNALESFYLDKSKEDGMHSQCISCETRGKRTSRAKPLNVEYGVKKTKKTTVKKNYSKSTLESFYGNEKKTITIAPHQRKLFEHIKNKNTKKKTIKCVSCEKTFPATNEYFSVEKIRSGNGVCKKCDAQRQREFTIQNKELTMFRRKKSSALRDGIEFNLNEDKWVNDMKRATTCGDCNGSMTCLSESRNERTSFDKIDPTKGYLENNTRLICIKCNAQKNDLSPEEWNAVLEVRERKGIIEKVDSGVTEYVRRQDTLDGFFNIGE